MLHLLFSQSDCSSRFDWSVRNAAEPYFATYAAQPFHVANIANTASGAATDTGHGRRFDPSDAGRTILAGCHDDTGIPSAGFQSSGTANGTKRDAVHAAKSDAAGATNVGAANAADHAGASGTCICGTPGFARFRQTNSCASGSLCGRPASGYFAGAA